MKLRVLFAASECTPLVKVNSLADAVGSLPKALAKAGVDVAVALPGYKHLADYEVLPGSDIPLFLVENEEYFGNSEAPYRDLAADAKRFAYFSRQVVQQMARWGFEPDVVHAHDWYASLIPAVTKKMGLPYASVLTVHDLATQGISADDVPFPAGLSECDLRGLEWDFQDKNIDLLLQGLIHADVINTVSPTYAREILTPESSEGLHDVLRACAGRLCGVLSGIDYDSYDPANDTNLFRTFGPDDVAEGKAMNKEALQRELGLAVDEKAMLVGFTAPLVDRNGLSLIVEGFKWMMEMPLQFVLLGAGDYRYERQFEQFAASFPSKFSAQIKTDEALARRLYAAADLFIIPSRFEPCGLTQMVAMRYGALPLVRAVGGLNDSVIDGADGFVFEKYEARQMAAVLRRALRVFKTPVWAQMVGAVMRKDFSWDKVAREYIPLYERAIDYARK